VRKVDGKETIYVDEFILALGDNVGREVSISVDREVGGVKDTVTKNVYVREEPPEDEGALGVVIVSDTYYPALYLRPFYGVYFGFKQSVFWTKLVLGGLPKLFSDITTQGVPKDIAGPVGIFVITSETVKFGYIAILNLLGILSVNLAIINVLPIPALDGGRLLFILIEGIIGRKVVPKVEAVIHTVGFVALITLLLALTIREVGLIVSQGFSGFVETIIPR
jgi:regulator of sigma E protease